MSTRQSVHDSVGQEWMRRNRNVQPTLTIRAGYPLRIVVGKDVLRRYHPLFIDQLRAMTAKLKLGRLPSTEM